MPVQAAPSLFFLEQLHAGGNSIGAVILAGGLARRMGGQDKGLVPLAGRAMAQWVLDAVKPQVDEVVINANRNRDLYNRMGVMVVADSFAGYQGPLAGLSAGIAVLQTDFIFMCPCDSPFIADCVVARLGEACLEQNVDIAVAHDGDRLQPVFCVVHRRLADSLDGFLRSGERKIDRWYAQLAMATVDCQDLGNMFDNINTDEERDAAERKLAQLHSTTGR